jgi:hypothetical protein
VAVRIAVVDVNDSEADNSDREVELIDLHAAADAVTGLIDEVVAVLIEQVLGNDGEVPYVDLEVRVGSTRKAGIEDDQLVGASFVGNSGDVDARGSVLLVEQLAVLQPLEVEREVRTGRTFAARAGGRADRRGPRGCGRWGRCGRWYRRSRRTRGGTTGRRLDRGAGRCGRGCRDSLFADFKVVRLAVRVRE